MSENPADVPRGQCIPVLIAHLDAVARQRGPTMNEFTTASRTLLKRRRQIFLFQRIHVDGVALHPAAERSEAQCQRYFRHAVTSDETFRMETAWSETGRKAREDRKSTRLNSNH